MEGAGEGEGTRGVSKVERRRRREVRGSLRRGRRRRALGVGSRGSGRPGGTRCMGG